MHISLVAKQERTTKKHKKGERGKRKEKEGVGCASSFPGLENKNEKMIMRVIKQIDL